MKKKIMFLLVTSIVVVLALCGCSSTVSSDKVKKSIESGLSDRWEYQSTAYYDESKGSELVEYYNAAVDYELEPIVKYKESEFENAELGKLVKAYIGVLENQKKMLADNNGDPMTIDYNFSTYQWERHNLLKEIDQICQFEFEGEDAETFDDIISEKYYEKMKDNPKQVDEAFSIITHSEKKVYDWYEAKIKVRNNTDRTYATFALIYRLKAKDGTILESEEYVYIDEFVADSVTWTDDYGYEFKEGRSVEIYGYAYHLEDGYIGQTIDLKEPLVINID